MFFGIDGNTGFYYEGMDAPIHPIISNPHISRAVLISNDADMASISARISDAENAWIFREDSFDPVTRTRRGRLYVRHEAGQPARLNVRPHPADYPAVPSIHLAGIVPKEIFSFIRCAAILDKPNQGMGLKLALGSASAFSIWRIVQTEVLANRTVLVTLRSLNAFGILPELDLNMIEPSHQPAVRTAYERAIDSAFKESPISVVDHCKNAIAVILSRWMVQMGNDPSVLSKDIGDVAKAISNPPHKMYALEKVSLLMGRLHARGKSNEQHDKEARIPTEEDAQLSLESLGFVLRDIGWAK
jgi:hypothetical protein